MFHDAPAAFHLLRAKTAFDVTQKADIGLIGISSPQATSLISRGGL
jgi:hypothetical protein